VRTGLASNEIDSLHVLLRHRSGRGPRLDLDGREHLEGALRRGRGALLLLHSFHWTSHLLTLPAHGFPVLRVTDESHGRFWTSRAGRRWLHPRQIRLESPEGVTRLVARAGSFAHLRRISRALRENRLVLQRALSPGATPGPLRSETVPFMEGSLALGTTPIAIARDAGAPVIPIYPFREGPDRYRLVVDEPLPGGRDALRVAAARLEPRVLLHPDQWTTWRQVRVDAR
jgi:lauroyl/myristoyl acyltransferase